MMKNTQENTKTKNNASLIIAILGVIVCLVFIVMMMFPGSNDGYLDPPDDREIAREYWTAELQFYAGDLKSPYLKKISVDEDGNVLRIESKHPKKPNAREIFFYKNGMLKYSETYSIRSGSAVKEIAEKKLYETRYVYMGDIVTKAEVYVNGTPTRSYDKYVYKIGGELSAIEKYEKGKLEITYFYNGKDYPERVEHTNGVSYDLEYDENGNLTRATSEDFLVEIDYENGYPTRFYKAYYDRKASDESVKASFVADTQKNETITTYVYGDNGEILEETSEIIVTYYNKGEQTHIEGYTEAYTYEYDDENRLTDVKHYLREKFNSWYRYAYDSEGRRISTINCDENGNNIGKNSEVTRSADGLTLEVTIFSLGVELYTTIYKYEEDGVLVKQTQLNADGTVGYDDTLEYYRSGALKKKVRVQGGDTETWTYFENGNLKKYVCDDRYDIYDASAEYIKSDIYYGFMRQEGFDYTFSLPIVEEDKRYITYYEYGEDLELEKKTRYDKDGNVIFEHDYTAKG